MYIWYLPLEITIIAFQGWREHKLSMFLIWKSCMVFVTDKPKLHRLLIFFLILDLQNFICVNADVRY